MKKTKVEQILEIAKPTTNLSEAMASAIKIGIILGNSSIEELKEIIDHKKVSEPIKGRAKELLSKKEKVQKLKKSLKGKTIELQAILPIELFDEINKGFMEYMEKDEGMTIKRVEDKNTVLLEMSMPAMDLIKDDSPNRFGGMGVIII